MSDASTRSIKENEKEREREKRARVFISEAWKKIDFVKKTGYD
jgi:hypothetical protein